MCIEIKAVKVLEQGVPGYKVLKVKALTKDQLPDEYKTGLYVYMTKRPHGISLLVQSDKPLPTVADAVDYYHSARIRFSFIIEPNVFYLKEKFEARLKVIRQCGDRLHKINKERMKKWTSNQHVTFKI